VDHLDGIMFVDRLDVLTREAKLREWQEMRQRRLSATSNL
jgi:peptide deformylase